MKLLLLALQGSLNVLFVGASTMLGVVYYAANHGITMFVYGIPVIPIPYWMVAGIYVAASAELWGLWNLPRAIRWAKRWYET